MHSSLNSDGDIISYLNDVEVEKENLLQELRFRKIAVFNKVEPEEELFKIPFKW
jgi:hypothetical protein